MNPGKMRMKVELLRPVVETDRFGAQKTIYEPYGTVWAERARISGRRVEEDGELFADYSVNFNIRYAHPVSDNWRVHKLGDPDDVIYEVTNVIPYVERGMKQLNCERVNV